MLKHVETTSFNLCSRSSILGEHYNLRTSCPTVCLVTVKSIAGTTAAQLRGSTSVNQASLRYWSEDIGIVVTFHHPCRTQIFHGHHWEADDDCASPAAQWSVKRARGILFFKSVESNVRMEVISLLMCRTLCWVHSYSLLSVPAGHLHRSRCKGALFLRAALRSLGS